MVDESVAFGPKAVRVLSCSRCDMSITLNLSPQDLRPTHRCKRMYKAMPFDRDMAEADVPKKTVQWFEEAPKHPRPPTGDRRPQIVL